jgi:hypothetical protein
MTTTTTKLAPLEAVSLETVTGGCHKGGGCPPPQQQQQAFNRPPMPMGRPPDDKVEISVDAGVGVQSQSQTVAA